MARPFFDVTPPIFPAVAGCYFAGDPPPPYGLADWLAYQAGDGRAQRRPIVCMGCGCARPSILKSHAPDCSIVAVARTLAFVTDFLHRAAV